MFKLGKRAAVVTAAVAVAVSGGAAWAYFGLGGLGGGNVNVSDDADGSLTPLVVSGDPIVELGDPANVTVTTSATKNGAKVGDITISINTTDAFWTTHPTCLATWFSLGGGTANGDGSVTITGGDVVKDVDTPFTGATLTLNNDEAVAQNGCLNQQIPLTASAVAAG
ncbi:MAG: hypothetical protein JXA67_12025 [Micromonosporaceae bacterium]|nr:hypothetical protein [Micromonosporaceae bacterium]